MDKGRMPVTLFAFIVYATCMLYGSGAVYACDTVVAREDVVCCAGAFNINEITKEVKLSPPRKDVIHLWTVRSHKLPLGSRPGYAEQPIAIMKSMILRDHHSLQPIAYIVQSETGASIVLWSPVTEKYESGRIWGDDVLYVDEKTDIVYMSNGVLGPRAVRAVSAYVWRRGSVSVEEAKKVMEILKYKLKIERILLYISDMPVFWTATGVPSIVPAFGSLGLEKLEQIREIKYLVCASESTNSPERCWWSRHE